MLVTKTLNLVVCMFKVVFRNGDGALRVLPPLIDVIHEARLNLAVYYLRQGMYSAYTI